MHEIYVEKVDKLNVKYIKEISFNNMNKKKFKSYENKVKKWIENEINRIYNERMECLTFSSDMGDANEMYIRSYGILNEIEKNCKEQKINCYIVDNS